MTNNNGKGKGKGKVKAWNHNHLELPASWRERFPLYIPLPYFDEKFIRECHIPSHKDPVLSQFLAISTDDIHDLILSLVGDNVLSSKYCLPKVSRSFIVMWLSLIHI